MALLTPSTSCGCAFRASFPRCTPSGTEETRPIPSSTWNTENLARVREERERREEKERIKNLV